MFWSEYHSGCCNKLHHQAVLSTCLLMYQWWYVIDCSRGIIELGDVTVHNVKQLKRLNQAIFPVIYNDKFYKDVLQFGELVKLGIV